MKIWFLETVQPDLTLDAPVYETLLIDLKPGPFVIGGRGYDPDWIRAPITQLRSIPIFPSRAYRRHAIPYDTEMTRCATGLRGTSAS